MRPGARTVSVNDPLIKKVIRLLSQLNDPRGDFVGQIFEPYFTTKRADDGIGLGLTSVRRIVQAHNGQIIVESEEGQGSTFTVVFPKEQAI